MNPCKCGYAGSAKKTCQCAPGEILRYQRRVSGPLIDRFDLHVLVSDIPVNELLDTNQSKINSKQAASQALSARKRAIKRQNKTNSELSIKQVHKYCQIDNICRKLLLQAEEKFHLSPRGVHRLLKVSRTIADLDEADTIQANHLAEALQYREQLQAALPELI